MNNMNTKELKAMAKELKVKNWWNLKKDELIREIQKLQNEAKEEAKEVKSKRKQDLIEYNGEVKNLSQWAKELGMPGQTLYARLRISKWSVEKAFTTPIKKSQKEEEA